MEEETMTLAAAILIVLAVAVLIAISLPLAIVLLAIRVGRSARWSAVVSLGVILLGLSLLVPAASFAYRRESDRRDRESDARWEWRPQAVETAAVDVTAEVAAEHDLQPLSPLDAAAESAGQPPVADKSAGGDELPLVPPGRPAWVELPSSWDGDLHRSAVSSGPFVTTEESRNALEQQVARATNQYVEWYVRNHSRFPRVPITCTSDDVALVKRADTYQELLQTGVGPMHQQHVLLEFDRALREQLDQRVQQTVVQHRLVQLWGLVGGVLTVLATLLAYLRLDTWLQGVYRGPLRLAAATLIVAVVGGGFYLARLLPIL
jgi:hypothetical protein